MGCTAKEVTGTLSGSALMREPDLAARLIEAAVNATSRPVTLKIRLGSDDQNRNAPEIAALAERLGVKAVTVHGRARQTVLVGKADWHAVAEVKTAAGAVIVNSDITDAASAREALAQSGADALMIGRGAYGRPWVAAALDNALNNLTDIGEPGPASRLGIALQHFTDTLRFYGDALGLKIFRKHLGWYVEQASCPADPAHRRAAKARMCQIDNASGVEFALAALWSNSTLPILAPAHM